MSHLLFARSCYPVAVPYPRRAHVYVYARSQCTSQSNADRNVQANHLGYVSSLSLIIALDEWIEIRRWCLYTLMCALVQLEGGVDAMLEGSVSHGTVPISQKALIFHVIPAHHADHDGNPALAFQLARVSVVARDSDDYLRANWEDVKNKAKAAGTSANMLFRALGADKLAPPVGILPAVFMVDGTDIVYIHGFTLYHLPLRHLVGNLKDAPDARTRAACEELVAIAKDLLDKTLLFWQADDLLQPEPYWGIYERTGARKKQWKGVQLAIDQNSWRLWEEQTDERWPGRTSGLTSRQVLMLFDFTRVVGMR